MIDRERRGYVRDGTLVELTGKEFAIAELLAARPGVVRTRAEILDMLGNYNSDLRSVDCHMKRLRRKGLPIRTRYDLGYSWGG